MSEELKPCPRCEGERWVCENHPDVAWLGDNCCGGAGKPCPSCNPNGWPLTPSEDWKGRAEAAEREQGRLNLQALGDHGKICALTERAEAAEAKETSFRNEVYEAVNRAETAEASLAEAVKERDGWITASINQRCRAETAEARTALAVEALTQCRDQFHRYALSHKAKETAEGDEKAMTNAAYAALCDHAIAALKAPPSAAEPAGEPERTYTAAQLAEARRYTDADYEEVRRGLYPGNPTGETHEA